METVEDALISTNDISQCANPGCGALMLADQRDEDDWCPACHSAAATAFVAGLRVLLEENNEAF